MKLTPADIINCLKMNIPVIVEFNKKIVNYETCLDANMKGKIISCIDTGDDFKDNGKVYKLRIDLSEFDGYNDQFFSANYYDKAGVPCLNCKQAGRYPKDHIEDLYLESINGQPFEVFKGKELSIHYREYLKNSPDNMNYIQWLEAARDQLLVITR
jgi:hypothetical protein